MSCWVSMNFNFFKKQEVPRDPGAKGQRVCLHIGVHKTGSTHLQGVLKQNRLALAKASIYYLPLKQCREVFTLPCIHKKLGSAERGAAFFEQAFSESRTALISDENLIGVVDTLLAGHFYPRMVRNIKRIRAMIGPHRQLDLYCCVRNYADWIESAYLQTLKRRITPFDAFLKKLTPEKLSWSRFVEELSEASGSAKINLWTYESYVHNSDAILDKLASDVGAALPKKPDSRPNPSLSEAAVKILAAADKDVRKEDRAKLYRFVRMNFSTNQKYAKPRLLSQELRSSLDLKYRKDLQALHGLSSVRFMTVEPLQATS